VNLKRQLRRMKSGAKGPSAKSACLVGIPGLETREVAREEGAFLLHDERFPRDHRHGDVRLAEALALAPEAISLVAVDESLATLTLDQVVYLDTETTGLAGGAGTYVFLVGVGWFEGDAFRLRQFYMRDHREERAMMAALNDFLTGFAGLVTFHGKSFDVPRIRDRMLALHVEPTLPVDHHLDLCIVGRRLWKGKHPDGRLQTLEAAECGFHRTDDLPGAECPEAWFAYLRGEGERMARVFEHNRDDILSLVTLAARVGQVGEGRGESRERLVRAKLLAGRGDGLEAEEVLRDLARRPAPAWVRRHALRELAPLLRRRGATEDAAACWTALRREDPADVTPLVEIAKHLEHRRRDPSAALEITEEALRRAAVAPRTSLLEELEHRKRRLLRKAKREGGGP